MKRLVKDKKQPPRRMVTVTPTQDKYIMRVARRERINPSAALRKIIQDAYDRELEVKRLARELAE